MVANDSVDYVSPPDPHLDYQRGVRGLGPIDEVRGSDRDWLYKWSRMEWVALTPPSSPQLCCKGY